MSSAAAFESALVEAVRGLCQGDPVAACALPVLRCALASTQAQRGFALWVADKSVSALCAVGTSGVALACPQFKFSRTVVGRVLETGSPLLTLDAQQDDRLRSAQSIRMEEVRAILAVPARASEREHLILYMDARSDADLLAPPHVEIAGRLARHLAPLLVAAREIEALRRTRDSVQRMQVALDKYSQRTEAEGKTEAGTRTRLYRAVLERLRTGPAAQAVRVGFEGIIWRSAAMAEVIAQLDRIVESPAPILILGETGTGKEVVARAVHAASPRASRPFCAVNCAALTESVLEDELFGHVRGAFTGADRDREGIFEQARDGTVFLDEAGEMGLAMQAKLLRVLEAMELRRLGDERTRPLHCRLIAATNRDLASMVKDGKFREDLFYRVNVLSVRIPPLRERPEDIPALCEHILAQLGRSRGMVRAMSEEAMKLLVTHAWPGNVRELRNVLTRADAVAKERIEASDIAFAIGPTRTDVERREDDSPLTATTFDDAERGHIIRILRQTGGHPVEAARILGVSHSTLWRKMQKFGIRKEEWAG